MSDAVDVAHARQVVLARSALESNARAAAGAFAANTKVSAQYRVNLFVWGITFLTQIIVYMVLWRAVAEARGGEVGGFTPATFAGYYLIVLFVRESTHTSFAWRFARLVQRGELSPRLLRPAHPIVQEWGSELAVLLQTVLLLAPVGVMLWLGFDATIRFDLVNTIAALVLLPAAMFVRCIAECLVGMLSFWVTRVEGIRGIYVGCVLFLSGQFAPLSVMPDMVRTVAKVLPFWWLLGYPVELIAGTQPLSAWPQAVAVLGIWSVVLFIVFRFEWRAGVRQYGAVGA